MENDKVLRRVPFGGLAIAAFLALATVHVTPAYAAGVLGTSAVACVWLWWGMEDPDQAHLHRTRTVVYYAGLLAIIAVLVVLSPWFGFFGFVGYMHVAMLPNWGLRAVAIVCTAFLQASTQAGGVGNIKGDVVYLYLVLVVTNMLLAGYFAYAGIAEHERGLAVEDANRRLKETLEENAGLHAQLVSQAREAGILDERQRLAGEIHDTIAQGLTGIIRQLEVAERCEDDAEKRHHHLGLARALARESLAEARRSVQALRPGPLEKTYLPEALADLTADWSKTSGIAAGFDSSGDQVPLAPAFEVVLFRAAQEALANAAKYSQAGRVGITLSYMPGLVVLDVVDDGLGFDQGAAIDSKNGTGFGLSSMRSRLIQVGGMLTIESAPGEGTAISARVPTVAGQ